MQTYETCSVSKCSQLNVVVCYKKHFISDYLYFIIAPPQVSLEPIQPIVLNDILDTFTLMSTCTAAGIPRPLIAWTFGPDNSQLESSSSRIDITTTHLENVTTSTVNVQNLSVTDRGSYITCNASNVVAQDIASGRLYVAGK